jgi:hypothetical protein
LEFVRMSAKPHVSPALVQLRRWVTLAALMVCLCAAAQMLVFGFVHYTEVRWTFVEAKAEAKPLKIVKPDELAKAADGKQDLRAAAGRLLPAGGAEDSGLEVNRVLSETDSLLGKASTLAVTFGIVGACILCLLTMLGVAVAGGGAVPGVEKAVTACAWSVVLALVCLPWRDIMPSVPIPGVFGGYERMTEASEAVLAAESGGSQLLARYVLLPGLAVVCGALVCVWFRNGVEQGVIVEGLSEAELAAEQEMTHIASSGVGGRQARAGGALSRTMGDSSDGSIPTAGPLRFEPPPPKVARERPMGAVDPGDRLARPI